MMKLFSSLTHIILISVLTLSLVHAQDKSGNKKFTQKEVTKIAELAAEQAVKKALFSLDITINNESQQNHSVPKGVKKNNAVNLFRIGTGSVGGNYFVLGELVGGVISHPIGSLLCGQGGTCGLNNFQSLNITSAGSMANIVALKKKTVDSAFIQSDVAYWAYTGTGLFEAKDKMDDLRAIASLYPEAVHIVYSKKSDIKSVSELKGKEVSIGAKDSGTLLQAKIVLEAYGLSESDINVHYLNNQQSIKKLQDGSLEAMFFSVGAPAPSLTELFNSSDEYSLLPITSVAKQRILKKGSYFSPYVINKGTYNNIDDIETISVFALWLCSSKQSKEFIYEITKALWSESSQQLFNSSKIGAQINIKNSLKGIGIPLHDGAKQYYNKIGKRY